MTTKKTTLPPVNRRAVVAVLAGGAALAVGAPALTVTAAEPEPDAPLLRDCLDYLDGIAESDRLAEELGAVCEALGVSSGSKHPDVVEAWHRLDVANDHASDFLNSLCHAEAVSVLGVFAKVAAVVRFELDGADDDVADGVGWTVLPDLLRLVKPSAGPLVRRILAHPALVDVFADDPPDAAAGAA